MKKPILLIGGGGHCKSVIDVAEKAGFKIDGIIDLHKNIGKSILGYEIIGVDDDIKKYTKTHLFHITVGQIGSSKIREILYRKVKENDGKLVTIISSSACVSGHSIIGEGTIIMHNAIVNADVKIGKACIINTLANIEHDSFIGDFSHISTGVTVNGNCTIGSNCFIGSQSAVSNGISICNGSFVCIGSVITKSNDVKGTYAGNPARRIK